MTNNTINPIYLNKYQDLKSVSDFNGEGKEATIFWGGWDGHEPDKVAARITEFLESKGMKVTSENSQDKLDDLEFLKKQHLIIPAWTMGKIDDEKVGNISTALSHGTGLAGVHGGMCDAFRENVFYQFITGGNWVAHPGSDSVTYEVQPSKEKNLFTEGIKPFEITSEQYYLHVDPAVKVHATTPFPQTHWYHSSNGPVAMPVLWSKYWGYGRVFYTSLGHKDKVFDVPEAWETFTRGLLWAARGKDLSLEENLSGVDYENEGKMF